jgi:hypothetical protein
VEHIIDVAWSLFETRKVEAASQMKMWDTDGDKALGVKEVSNRAPKLSGSGW